MSYKYLRKSSQRMIDSLGKKTMLRKENRMAVVDAIANRQEPVYQVAMIFNILQRPICKSRRQNPEKQQRTVIKSIFLMMTTRYISNALA